MKAQPTGSGLDADGAGSDLRVLWALLLGLPASAVRALIRIYQLTLSPFIGNQCRFHPSCSNYAMEAVEHHGALKGSWLALRRLGRCHPYHPGGFDPVPRRGKANCCTAAPEAAASARTPTRTMVPGSMEN